MQSIRFYEISDPFIWELSHTLYKCVIYIYLFMKHVDVVKSISYLQREFISQLEIKLIIDNGRQRMVVM